MTEALVQRTGAQAIVDALIGQGVDTVFGIPGIQLDHLFDAFYERRNELRVVTARHEQGAAFMAMGYAQACGRPGVFAVVPGPGVLNSLAAMGTARAGSIPVLGLTAQIASHMVGRDVGMSHELRDQLMACRGVVDWAKRGLHPAQGASLVREAFAAMTDGRGRPAFLEMPPDIMGASAAMPATDTGAEARPDPVPEPLAGEVERAAALLGQARKPLILAGSGAFGAEAALQALAERLNAPVTISPAALGVLPRDHPLAFDTLSGQELWKTADAVLIVGKRFATAGLAWGRRGDVPMIRIDIDPKQMQLPYEVDIPLVTSAQKGLEALLAGLAGLPIRPVAADPGDAEIRETVAAKLAALEPLHSLCGAIRRALPADGIFVMDPNQLGYYAYYGFQTGVPRTFLPPANQWTLGYAVPAAIGAKIACPDRKVIAVAGDGGFMFSLQDMATAMLHKAGVVFIVFNNGAYGNVKQIQAESYGARHIAVDLQNPDFVDLARSFGMEACRADTPDDLEAALRRYLESDRPALIEIKTGATPFLWNLPVTPSSMGRKRP